MGIDWVWINGGWGFNPPVPLFIPLCTQPPTPYFLLCCWPSQFIFHNSNPGYRITQLLVLPLLLMLPSLFLLPLLPLLPNWFAANRMNCLYSACCPCCSRCPAAPEFAHVAILALHDAATYTVHPDKERSDAWPSVNSIHRWIIMSTVEGPCRYRRYFGQMYVACFRKINRRSAVYWALARVDSLVWKGDGWWYPQEIIEQQINTHDILEYRADIPCWRYVSTCDASIMQNTTDPVSIYRSACARARQTRTLTLEPHTACRKGGWGLEYKIKRNSI